MQTESICRHQFQCNFQVMQFFLNTIYNIVGENTTCSFNTSIHSFSHNVFQRSPPQVLGWLVKCISWLSHNSTNTNFFPKPPTTFFTFFGRGERQKYARKKVTQVGFWVVLSQDHEVKGYTIQPRSNCTSDG